MNTEPRTAQLLHPGYTRERLDIFHQRHRRQRNQQRAWLDIVVKFMHRTGENQRPLLDHPDVVASRLHLRQDMRREDHRPLAGDLLDQVTHLHDLVRV